MSAERVLQKKRSKKESLRAWQGRHQGRAVWAGEGACFQARSASSPPKSQATLPPDPLRLQRRTGGQGSASTQRGGDETSRWMWLQGLHQPPDCVWQFLVVCDGAEWTATAPVCQ